MPSSARFSDFGTRGRSKPKRADLASSQDRGGPHFWGLASPAPNDLVVHNAPCMAMQSERAVWRENPRRTVGSNWDPESKRETLVKILCLSEPRQGF